MNCEMTILSQYILSIHVYAVANLLNIFVIIQPVSPMVISMLTILLSWHDCKPLVD